ncbi:unnamed protein product [Fusarium graminearum]|uniref:Chromosome 2, complete genome n=1 Tax=Gibberella zeae (strain ATCC MYA-4620 / CBS 123657 / FGSC 9075 / NRRL 31084 / PH-1) TaxID=229533 RepID=A0A098DDI3_GIBZE|nr:unnamed protein product [Fusarium graminearum]
MLIEFDFSLRQKSQLPQLVQKPRAASGVAWYRDNVVCEVKATLDMGTLCSHAMSDPPFLRHWEHWHVP